MEKILIKNDWRKPVVLFKKKCVICRQPFPAVGPRRVTCGHDCKEKYKIKGPRWRVQPFRAMLKELERLAKVESKVLPPSHSPEYHKVYSWLNSDKINRKRRERYYAQIMLRELEHLAFH